MDRSSVIKLISQTYTQDAIGQQVPHEISRSVYCNVASVSAKEWFDAGQVGLNPQYKLTLFAPDYQGEAIVELEGKRYAVYRTYRSTTELLELYLERKAGI